LRRNFGLLLLIAGLFFKEQKMRRADVEKKICFMFEEYESLKYSELDVQ
jgi:hypothetical protein